MSVIVKRLVARGLVERRTDPGDRRATLVAITPLGTQALRERAQLRSSWFAERLDGLDAAERHALSDAVTKLMATFR
jgi:DNA-binding MarR family transcriptional regulator